MSIVTKTGDSGETSLMFNRRVSKSDPRVEAYGCVDELTSALGLARALSDDPWLREQILAVQKDLIGAMGELATLPEDMDRYVQAGYQRLKPHASERLTAAIAELEKDKSLYPKDWVIPGETKLAAALDLARTAARRAERAVVASQGQLEDPEILRYLNRLSDFCWILARRAEKAVRSP